MAAKFKWGLLSTARINQAILGGMAHSERGEVAAVGSRDKARAEAYAAARASAVPTVATKSCWPTPTSRSSITRSPTTCTRSGPSRRCKPASMCCARSLSP